MEPPKTKSVFINQLDGGYTVNFQGNDFYPVKVFVSAADVCDAITTFFNSKEITIDTLPAQNQEASPSDIGEELV